jgi:site-specific DNA-methyltransferase (adenine-specific)
MRRIIHGDNLEVLPRLPRRFARLAYIDPPFNTGRIQKRDRMRVRSAGAGRAGERTGFGGKRFSVERVASSAFADTFDDYVGFLLERIELALPCLTPDASLFVHLDAREVHYVKVALDRLLGRESFINEIIWSYDYGARSKTRWSNKHDTILWYALDPKKYVFEYDAIDRIPYLAPKLVTPEKAARGKTPTDVWWHTIVPTAGREKTGYPTQKPLGILERVIRVHSRPRDVVLDFFGGSGTTGEAAAKHGRGFVLVDANVEACRVAAKRLARFDPQLEGFARA